MSERQLSREALRLRAWALKQEGWKQRRIAQALGVTESAVSQWVKRASAAGEASLRAGRPTGFAPRLTRDQLAQLQEAMAQGPEAAGFPGSVWTASRVTVLIRASFGISYHRSHVRRLLLQAGWTFERRGADAVAAGWVRRDRPVPVGAAKRVARGRGAE